MTHIWILLIILSPLVKYGDPEDGYIHNIHQIYVSDIYHSSDLCEANRKDRENEEKVLLAVCLEVKTYVKKGID